MLASSFSSVLSRCSLARRNMPCDCERCSVDNLVKAQYGLILGYKPCCVEKYSELTPFDFQEWSEEQKTRPRLTDEESDWWRVERKAGRFFFISDWVRFNLLHGDGLLCQLWDPNRQNALCGQKLDRRAALSSCPQSQSIPNPSGPHQNRSGAG